LGCGELIRLIYTVLVFVVLVLLSFFLFPLALGFLVALALFVVGALLGGLFLVVLAILGCLSVVLWWVFIFL